MTQKKQSIILAFSQGLKYLQNCDIYYLLKIKIFPILGIPQDQTLIMKSPWSKNNYLN